MNLIVAVDENWGIGKGNDLLFSVPEDMKFFRSTTMGKYVVCGRKTLESFPGQKPLPNRFHFVLTRTPRASQEGLVFLTDGDSLRSAIASLPEDDVFLIGGAEIYRQFYSLCKRAYVTKIFAADPDADAHFPNLDEDPNFFLAEQGEVLESKNGLRYSFCVYENRNV